MQPMRRRLGRSASRAPNPKGTDLWSVVNNVLTEDPDFESIFIHPADAVVGIPLWPYYTWLSFRDIPVRAREWVDRGEVRLQKADRTVRKSLYDVAATRLVSSQQTPREAPNVARNPNRPNDPEDG